VLICIDPFRDANTGEENSNDDMRMVMHHVRAIRDVTGAAVLLVHHLSKPPGNAKDKNPTTSIFDRFRGAGALRGSWDGALGKEARVKTPNCIKARMEAETRGGRSAGVFGLQLDITDDGHGNAQTAGYAFFRDVDEMMGKDGEGEKGAEVADVRDSARKDILGFLHRIAAKNPNDPGCAAPFIAQGTGLSLRTVQRHLQALERAAFVNHEGRRYFLVEPEDRSETD